MQMVLFLLPIIGSYRESVLVFVSVFAESAWMVVKRGI
jgi:hypothetical protein